MSILNDPRSDHQIEADIARDWEPESEGEWDDEPIAWLPVDYWFDRRAELFEAEGSDLADYVANWLRETAKGMRALDAATLDEYIARAETYPI